MQRFQVKTRNKSWDDPGPDLLRRRPTAVATALSFLDVNGPWWARKRAGDGSWWNWVKIGDRKAVEKYLFATLPTLNNNQMLQIALKRPDGEMLPRVALRCADVMIPDLLNATVAAEEVNALIQYRYPPAIFAGCFVCKKIEGSSSWSDHAWGDAVDETEDKAEGVTNDQITDWTIRMAREGEMQVEQVIGSRDGKVINASGPNFPINFGGASSHLWHTHISCHQHSGVPPCA